MNTGMANAMFGIYDAAGAGDGFIHDTGWFGWFDDGPAPGGLGTISYLGFLDSYTNGGNTYEYALAGKAHYYYLNLVSGVVFAIPEPAGITLLGFSGLVILRRRRHVQLT
ncbi:MAG: hypothetical protein K9N51_09105 [Candidatus Pacebacteria bacterium]|nr:hypothetical protein [Candidatus Paceibacterota bacterium]